MDLPAPYRSTTTGDAIILAPPATVEGVRQALEMAGTLAAWAAEQPSAVSLKGRGTAWRVPAPEAASGGPGPGARGEAAGRLENDASGKDARLWLVRHYRRGGLVAAPLLGDRYLARGEPRPVREIRVSHGARERGVPTPEVLAGVVYPAGVFYRADLATAFIPDSFTLADLLFGGVGRGRGTTGAGAEDGPEGPVTGRAADREAEAADREAGCRAAGAAIRLAHDAGLEHRDLNLRNVLLRRTDDGVDGYLLDLDAARLVDRAGGVDLKGRRAMLQRFWRSAGKFERATRRWLRDAEMEAFEAGYAGA